MFLVDTNVISEARKGSRADKGVQAFLAEADPAELYLSVQTLGEIRRGVENIRGRGDLPQAQRLETWLHWVMTEYADRILDFDMDCAQVWGKLMSPHQQHPIDKQIAAIALIHDLTVVTRNAADFQGTGVRLHNPFTG
ncbi:MAG TPA: type II toxin-antitoxin system VapC family toxin [Rhodocyclaceae bacterium]|nr:type II toxin-antitoxin system VapC family toxin [Rhodocyclaceae bacterium]